MSREAGALRGHLGEEPGRRLFAEPLRKSRRETVTAEILSNLLEMELEVNRKEFHSCLVIIQSSCHTAAGRS